MGIEAATAAPGLFQAIDTANAIVICPSNPWVSIGPILAIQGIRSRIEQKQVLAVSPIIGGQAVKGPAAKMYRELGFQSTSALRGKYTIKGLQQVSSLTKPICSFNKRFGV